MGLIVGRGKGLYGDKSLKGASWLDDTWLSPSQPNQAARQRSTNQFGIECNLSRLEQLRYGAVELGRFCLFLECRRIDVGNICFRNQFNSRNGESGIGLLQMDLGRRMNSLGRKTGLSQTVRQGH